MNELDLQEPSTEAEPSDEELQALDRTPEERIEELEGKVEVLERRFARAMMEVSSAIGRQITGDPQPRF